MDILIVEDDEAARLYLKRLLQSLGQRVFTCESGRDAWEICKQANFPVVITNWVVPGMSGLDLCRAVRSDDRRPRCYVIIASSRPTDRDRERAFEAGAAGYIANPIHKEILEARLYAISQEMEIAAVARLHTPMYFRRFEAAKFVTR